MFIFFLVYLLPCLSLHLLHSPRFEEFSKETLTIGEERVANANDIADALIMAGHNDAALIAEWKDNLNDAWADLGELIETRKMMLSASWELHKFFYDCKEVREEGD